MAFKNAACRGTSVGESPRVRRRNWESKFGCCAALSLTVLEVKRLLLLAVEMLVDSRAVHFAGALLPVIFSFVDVGIGFPVAVATLYAIRKYQNRPCYPNTKRVLRRVALILTICAILNIVTIALIGCRINFRTESLRDAFRTSMRFYTSNASYKIIIDELQLDLQCCGFSSYTDWFNFDWQGTSEYSDTNGEKEYFGHSIPYSCCNRRTMLPCIHAEMHIEDERTINSHGCAVVLSKIIFKIVVVGYVMTSLIMCTQILVIIFLIRIIRKVLPELCPSDCTCWESSCPMNTDFSYSSDECMPHCPERTGRFQDPAPRKYRRLAGGARKVSYRPRVIRKFCTSTTSSRCSSTSSPRVTSWSSDSSSSSLSGARLTSSPSFTCKPTQTANIAPSAQLQHQVPQNRKRGR